MLKDYGVARNETEQKIIAGIVDEGGRIARIVHDLLTFARRDSHEVTRVSVADTIGSSISVFGRQLDLDGILVEVDIEDRLPQVMMNGSLLRQVIINMVANARHALKNKSLGERMFRIKASSVRQASGECVLIEFYDTGEGIAPEHLDKVFDPFFTTRRDSGGTGLGLSLSFGIVRNYGGTITVESEQGNHTCFRVELPAACSREEMHA